MKKKEEGTALHAFASMAISRNIKLARTKQAINQFVNDAIGFRMDSEVVLVYSDNVFGTADAITFKNGLLRIHDLKTGDGAVKFDQLDIYAALFCLEYDVDPLKIDIVERLYQGSGFTEVVPEKEAIKAIMDKIIEFDTVLTNLKLEEANA